MQDSRPRDAGLGSPEGQHEQSDVRLRGIALFGVSLLIGGLVVHVLIWLLFVTFSSLNAGASREFPLAESSPPRMPPAPRLQEKPREELKALRKQEERLLTTYGWVDQATGVVRIPIDEAMGNVLQMDLPARTEQGGPAGAARPPADSNSGRPLEPGRR